jgi:predicted amidohydrolase YtcJ
MLRRIPLLVLLPFAAGLQCRPADEASLLLYNGVVYTVDSAFTVTEAVALRGDRIAAVGRSDELLGRFGRDHAVDLGGRAVYPGLIDAHAHMEGLGNALVTVDLRGVESLDTVRARVARQAAETPAGGWVRGRGWDQNLWPGGEFPTRHDLDAVAAEVPVYLRRIDGHAVWVNTAALKLAGITRATADPPGGRIIREAGGEPTGVFVDNATELVDGRVPPAGPAERRAAIARAVQECLRHGLTQAHDMGVGLEAIEIYRAMIAEDAFPFRVYALVGGAGAAWDRLRASGPDTGGPGARLAVRALKLYADGALGSRGAALLEPYTDEPGNRGLTVTSRETIDTLVAQAVTAGFQVCAHAIGDRGNRMMLDAYERAFARIPGGGGALRFRVEHAQILASDDIPRFARLGVIPSMQPTHCTSDMPWAEKRVGPARIRGAYAWRSLLETGVIIPGGSDFPVELCNPLHGFYAAVTRTDRSGRPPGGWYASEVMTREEALRSFTVWAAFSAFQEHEKGSLEPGKVADLVVLERDIMTIPAAAIPDVRVDATLVGGAVVYASPASPVR